MSAIAAITGRDKSTISRELSLNMCAKGISHEHYRASTAQKRYEARREKCKKPSNILWYGSDQYGVTDYPISKGIPVKVYPGKGRGKLSHHHEGDA